MLLPINNGKNYTHDLGQGNDLRSAISRFCQLNLCIGIIDNDGFDADDAKPAAKVETQQTPKKGPAVEGVAQKTISRLTTEERQHARGSYWRDEPWQARGLLQVVPLCVQARRQR